jgi:hypothetical protein
MDNPAPKISEEQVSEVLALAARLQAQQKQSYSLDELIQAGAEANIAPEFIQQAVHQLESQPLPDPKVATPLKGTAQDFRRRIAVAASILLVPLVLWAAAGSMVGGCHSRMSKTDQFPSQIQ